MYGNLFISSKEERGALLIGGVQQWELPHVRCVQWENEMGSYSGYTMEDHKTTGRLRRRYVPARPPPHHGTLRIVKHRWTLDNGNHRENLHSGSVSLIAQRQPISTADDSILHRLLQLLTGRPAEITTILDAIRANHYFVFYERGGRKG